MFQGNLKSASVKVKGCFNGIKRYFKETQSLFQKPFSDVLKVFQGSFKDVLIVLIIS